MIDDVECYLNDKKDYTEKLYKLTKIKYEDMINIFDKIDNYPNYGEINDIENEILMALIINEEYDIATELVQSYKIDNNREILEDFILEIDSIKNVSDKYQKHVIINDMFDMIYDTEGKTKHLEYMLGTFGAQGEILLELIEYYADYEDTANNVKLNELANYCMNCKMNDEIYDALNKMLGLISNQNIVSDILKKMIGYKPNDLAIWEFIESTDDYCLDLCNLINWEEIDDINIIKKIGYLYWDKGNDKAKDILEYLNKKDINNIEFQCSIGKYFFELGEIETSFYWFNKAFNTNSDNDICLFYLILICIDKQDKDRIEQYVRKLMSIEKNNYYMLLDIIGHIKNDYEFWFNELNLLVPIVCNDYISESGVLNNMINHIIIITNEMENKGEIRYQLILLYSIIKDIKENLKWEYTGKEGYDVCHYTKIPTLHVLTRFKDEREINYFRLYNTSYMNDPNEGTVLIDCIKRYCPDTVEIIKELYESDDADLKTDNTYIASFSTAIDKLPMWVQYGNDAKGCCCVIDSNVFNKYDLILDIDNYNQKENKSYSVGIRSKYPLYKLKYIDRDDLNGLNDYIIKIGECLKKLKRFKFNEEIKRPIKDMLDQIRFLFKDIAYQHEEELRIVNLIEPSTYDIVKVTGANENFIIPRLYINFDIHINYKEIILGPKVENYREIIPYLQYCRNVNKVRISKIKYR